MIAVTVRARLAGCFRSRRLRGGYRGMKAAFGLQPLRDRHVARQAFGIAHALANLMTRQTLGQALELRVRQRERSR